VDGRRRRLKIAIWGVGAVGLGLSSALARPNESLHIIGRNNETLSDIQTHGINRTGLFGDHHVPPEQLAIESSPRTLAEDPPDWLLVCTKAYSSAEIAQTLEPVARAPMTRTQLLLCQNGWGNAEIFAETFPKDRIKSARVITGFRRPQKHQVDITVHADAIHLGSLFSGDVSELAPLSAAIDAGGIPCQVTSTVSQDLWAKMLYNCMLNGWSTVFDVPYGVLGESPHTRELMENIAHEVYAVMTAAGYATHWTSAEDYIDTFYKHQLPPTTSHEPSMLQDIRAGKKTEIDALNGAVMQLGQKYNLPVPYNIAIYRIIKFMENQ